MYIGDFYIIVEINSVNVSTYAYNIKVSLFKGENGDLNGTPFVLDRDFQFLIYINNVNLSAPYTIPKGQSSVTMTGASSSSVWGDPTTARVTNFTQYSYSGGAVFSSWSYINHLKIIYVPISVKVVPAVSYNPDSYTSILLGGQSILNKNGVSVSTSGYTFNIDIKSDYIGTTNIFKVSQIKNGLIQQSGTLNNVVITENSTYIVNIK